MSSVATDVSAPAKVSGQRTIVWVLFLCSGICGLIYEVLWCRHLGLLFGNTVESMSAVLTAFMSGLALGSYVGGRYCEKLKRPMMAYGVLEILIGVYCAFLPWALGAESPILPFYRSLYGESGSGAGLHIARFVISFVLLLIPTTFMGATLPILAQYLVRSKAFIGKTVGALYAVNTFGAVLGAAMTGFLLLPMLGKASSNHLAVATNIILGTLAIVFGVNQSAPQQLEELPGTPGTGNGSDVPPGATGAGGADDQAPVSDAALKLAVLTFGITGFAALATQIGWTRAISLATGSSTYAFSLIVAVFILGLSFGGVWGSRAATTTKDPLALLGKVLIAIGLAGMALTALLGIAPQLFFVLLVWGSDRGWSWQLLFQALGISLLIIGPTFLMGATMPLTMQAAARSRGSAGRTVGTIYAVNTIGSILGSFFGGLVLLPKLGIQGTLQLMSVLYAVPGVVLYFMSKSGKLRRPRADFMIVLLGIATTVGVLFFAPKWNPKVMSSGMYLLRTRRTLEAARNFDLRPLFAEDPNQKLVYYNEGVSSTVAVSELRDDPAPPVLSLSVGGKPDATSHGDMSTQLGLTLVPVIIHEAGPESALVIGLGSGASAAAALALTTMKQVDVIEMSPEVVEASYYFAPYTGLKYALKPGASDLYWLDTPRLNLILNDGRNHMLLTSKKYDVIASEPSNPWLAGVGNLFTREAFKLCRERLNPGGVMCQWIHRYSLKESDFFNIVKTFAEVFPQAQLWCVNKHDFLLIGSLTEVRMPIERLRGRLADPGLKPLLERIHFDTDAEFLACFLSADAELRALSAKAELHTDDNMLLEFSAPKSLYNQREGLRSTQFEADPELVTDLASLKGAGHGGRAETEMALDLAVAAREHTRCAYEGAGEKRDHWFAASILAPYQLWVSEERNAVNEAAKRQLSQSNQPNDGFEKADQLAQNGQIKEAMALLQEAAAESIKRGERNNYAPGAKAVEILRRAGQAQEARATLQGLIQDPDTQTHPKAAKLRAVMALLLLDAPQPDPANALNIAKVARGLAEKDEALAHAANEKAEALEALRELAEIDESAVNSSMKKAALGEARGQWKDRAGELPAALEERAKFARGRADREAALGTLGEVLLKLKKYGQAYDEFHDLCSTHGLNVNYRLGLIDALLGMAADPELLKSHPELALKKLHHARRTAHEALKLKSDEAGAAARLARVQLRLGMLDASAAAFHRDEANRAWTVVKNLDKFRLLGELDGLQAEDLNNPARRRLWVKAEEFFKLDPVALKELMGEMK